MLTPAASSALLAQTGTPPEWSEDPVPLLLPIAFCPCVHCLVTFPRTCFLGSFPFGVPCCPCLNSSPLSGHHSSIPVCPACHASADSSFRGMMPQHCVPQVEHVSPLLPSAHKQPRDKTPSINWCPCPSSYRGKALRLFERAARCM